MHEPVAASGIKVSHMAKHPLTVRALKVVRRGRTVLWPGSGINFGNYLYLWLHAHARFEAGHPTYVLVRESALPWLDRFPELRALSLTLDDVRFFDERVMGQYSSTWGTDFGADELQAFVTSCLTTEAWLTGGRCTDDDDLVVNVRRGDYYAVDKFRKLYGMDQPAFLRRALERTCHEHGRPRRIRVISDGLDWCADNLGWLETYAPVDFGTPVPGPDADFAAIANARRLVLTNSTFSYWGAYVSDVLHPGSEDMVVVPRFHRRDINEGAAWQLNPRWTILERPTSGWGE